MKKTNLVKPLVLMLSMIGAPYSVYAQEVTTEDGSRINEKAGELTENDRNLKEVTVSSTRSIRRTDNIPNVVTITTAEEIQEGGARNIQDVFRDSPDVTVPQGAARFTATLGSGGRSGNASINIRGLEGNNVMMLVDGVRVPNAYNYGPQSTGRGSFLEVDSFRKIEVLRGPSSTQFGSDGLAGVVNFQTFNPTDLLKDGKDFGGFVRNGYNSVDSSDSTTLAFAGKNDQWSGMLLGNYRVGSQFENQGSNYATGSLRTAPNPAQYENWYVLGKAFLTVDSAQTIGLTLESQNTNQWTNLLSSSTANAALTSGYTNVWGKDTTYRDRISLGYDFKDYDQDWLQKASSQIYWQRAAVDQYTYDYRLSSLGRGSRTRSNSYDQDVCGINALLESNFQTLVQQRWTYGLDWSMTNFGVNNGGSGWDATTSAPFVPYKAAPNATQQLGGVFAQNELRYGDFDLIPGLRFDWYSTNPSNTSGYSGQQYSSQTDSAFSPRIGTVWNLVSEFRPFAQWAMAFQAPLPGQMYQNFENLLNPGQPYRNIPNPNLQAQTGNGYEVGARGQTGEFRYQASVYQNFYQNFINQNSWVDANGVTVFQYQNLANVNIWGWDLRTDWKFYPGWQANFAMAWSYGNSTYNGQTAPLNTIQPLRGIWGLRYDQPVYGAGADLVYNQGKQASRVNYNGDTGGYANQYLSPTSFVLNLTAYYKPVKNVTLNAYLNNAFNASYWNWANVQGAVASTNTAASAASIQAATSAPMNGGVSVRYDF